MSILNQVKRKVTIPAFFFKDELEPLATVISGVSGGLLNDKGQDLILEKQADLEVGASYSVIDIRMILIIQTLVIRQPIDMNTLLNLR